MARRIVINGRFLSQPVTGVQRYAREVVSALDRLLAQHSDLCSDIQFVVVVPSGVNVDFSLDNIEITTVGSHEGHRWEQCELVSAVGDSLLISFCNTGPLRVRNQIVTIHDASVFSAPQGYSLSFRLWYRFLHRQLVKKCSRVVTDSQFSLKELGRHCELGASDGQVIPLAADHLLRIVADSTVLSKSGLQHKGYVLAAGSLNPNKNMSGLSRTAEWLAAKGIPLVVVGGGNARVFQSPEAKLPSSVVFLGYVTDAQLRALYENATCFVFPSKYEGFGLPPLEAMACECPVICSRAASLPEVCADAALMVDPSDQEAICSAVKAVVEHDTLAGNLSRKGKERASKFTWIQTAEAWLKLIASCA